LFVSGHYKFTAVGQILQTTNNIAISGSFSVSIWLRRSTTLGSQYALNIGTQAYAASTVQTLTLGFRANSQMTFTFWNGETGLDTPQQIDQNVWTLWEGKINIYIYIYI
jgi:hypothetical protein